ncbi:ATP-binding protein [Streptomyces sp. NPDC031705]|uniref:ATP-binding protein n=1 Tax=Streptomyces sp. NPDC031705 TaxID=3155729 RepID=UPI0033D7CB0E
MEDWTSTSRILPVPPGGGVSCAEARDTARAVLTELEMAPERVEDALTVVSELIANARRHAGGVTAFGVTARAGAVTVEVSDRSPRLPQTRPWAPGEPGGFGWRLVNQLADATDVRFHRSHKTVTATFGYGSPQGR